MRNWTRRLVIGWCVGLGCLGTVSQAAAQGPWIEPGTGSVVFCFQQDPPAADNWRYVLNGAPSQPVTLDAAIYGSCPQTATHSFRLSGASFVLGNYIIVLQSVSAGGQVTSGPEYQFSVDVQAGPARVVGIFSVPPGE